MRSGGWSEMLHVTREEACGSLPEVPCQDLRSRVRQCVIPNAALRAVVTVEVEESANHHHSYPGYISQVQA